MAQKFIDQTTIQPDGKPGDDAFTAFATCNDNFHDAEQRLATLEAVGQDVENLKTGLQQEGDARLLGDDTLGQRIDAEKDARLALGARVIGKNRIINGDFRIWQRGTNFPAATGQRYTADRWQANATGSTIWVQRVDVPPGGGTVPMLKDSKYMLQAIVSSVANAANFALIQQRIEGLRANSGKTLTVSFKAKASVAGFKVGVEFQQSFGVGGSAGVDSIGASVTLGVDWQQYSVAIPVPSIVGKTFGEGDYLQLSFWLDAGANYGGRPFGAGQKSGTVSIAEVQVEAGAVATAFEYRPDSLELMLCQRYYHKSYNLDVAPGANSGQGLFVVLLQTLPNASYSSGVQIPLDPPMRDTPAVTVYPKYGGAGGFLTDDASSATRPATVAGVGQTGFYVFASTVSSNQINLQGHWTADAEL